MTVLCLILYSIFWALETERRDNPAGKLWDWARNHPSVESWYSGGNDKYNPSYPWTSDFLHVMIWGRLFSICGLAATIHWPFFFAFIPMGWLFILVYHVWLGEMTFKQYVRNILTLTNWH